MTHEPHATDRPTPRTLGSQGATVGPLGLGCMTMSPSYGPGDPDAGRATMALALERGITLFDTADSYASGQNEVLVGAFAAQHRDRVVLASKFGLRPSDPRRRVDGRPDYIRRCCDASLARLGVEVIDLYYQHRVDPDVPIEDSIGAMAELVDAGKVRWLGVSEPTADELRRADAVHPITAVQIEWSLWAREAEATVLSAARRLGVGIVTYAPLGRGFLTGALDQGVGAMGADDLRRSDPRLSGDNLTVNRRLLDELRSVAGDLGVTAAQLALAWVLSRGDDVVPIPSMETPAYLEENAAAMDLLLSEEISTHLSHIFAPGVTAGNPDSVLLRRR